MKRFNQIIFVVIIVCTFVTMSYSQSSRYMFSVKPDFSGLSGGMFGMKLPNNEDIVLFGGIDYFHLGSTIKEKTTYSPSFFNEYSSKTEVSLSVYNLYVGSKLFFQKTNDIKSYFVGEIAKPIVTGIVEQNGKEDELVQNTLDNLSIWGLKFGFGSEYFFSENFSLGGEFGLRVLIMDTQTEEEDSVSDYRYNPNTGEYEYVTYTRTEKTDVDFNFSLTYSVLTLNYYF